MTRFKGFFAATALAGTVGLAACQPEPEAAPPLVGLANPASTYCVESGGRSEIRRSSDGETGVCVLPDGLKVDEWEYYRANNPG